ncbi:group III truncated hemoglobin [Gellertiella hungarica]|uniref:Hemoglobin n=1 Tax=Gellertiella hungarica TaxID=1572859 RepID=A0A7W6J7V3_9HYPH|nr:globin [Gellertiella hungarica]MBB4066418.1 hemoglobin [Gellertiella hungarica]
MREELVGRAAHVEAIRQKAEAEMAAIGIDQALIERVVETFYGRIARHRTLGPVFEGRLAGRWDDHLAKMKRFWSAIAFKSGAYGGKPVQAHLGISGMREPLFADWLALFAETLQDVVPDERARAWFMATAERIAKSLQLALFYNPAIDDPAKSGLPSAG